MRASLIVVNYNGGSGLLKSLASLEASIASLDAEILLVDNHSTDGSANAAREEYREITVIDMPRNLGYAAAVNRGFSHARGDVLIAMNADIQPEGGAIFDLIAAMERHTEVDLFGGVLLDSAGVVSRTSARKPMRVRDILLEGVFLSNRAMKEADISGDHPVIVPRISGAVMGLRRSSLEKLGPMCEEYFLYNEDEEWCRRAERLSMKIAIVPRARFIHRGGDSTRKAEGIAFASRLLSDFQFFCEGENISARQVRTLWIIRLRFRAMLYWLDDKVGILGRRKESGNRYSIYALLAIALRNFTWSTSREDQNSHPDRLVEFPRQMSSRENDLRPTILQLITDMNIGGAQRLVKELVTGPLSREYRFEVLCLSHRGSIGRELKRNGLPVHRAGMSGWRNLTDWRRCKHYCALVEPAIVHSHLLPADFASMIGFSRGTARISTKHSIDAWMSPLMRIAERFILRNVATILAVGEEVALSRPGLARNGALPRVVPSPPTVPVCKEPAPLFRRNKPIRILILGRLHRVKKVEDFLQMSAILRVNLPGEFEFRIVGEGPEEDSLRNLAERLGVDDVVSFRGPIDDVVEELDDSDLVVLMSEGEGLPLTVLETMARGRVPVVRNAGGAVDSLPGGLTNCFVNETGPEAFVDKILEIRNSPEHFAELARGAVEWVAARDNYDSIIREVYEAAIPSRMA